jgi:HSP20 family molecular chaperone IbpA
MPIPKLSPTSGSPGAKPPRFIDRSEMKALEDAIWRRIAERAYDFFEASGCVHGNDLGNWLRAESEVMQRGLEIRESGSWLAINALLPGVSAEDVQIYVEPSRVIVRAEKKDTQESRRLGQAKKEVFLVADLNLEAEPATASASLKDQKLTLLVQKKYPGVTPVSQQSRAN